jgi:hypothetical protein
MGLNRTQEDDMLTSALAPSGTLGMQVVRARKAPLAWRIRNFPNLLKTWPGLLAARLANLCGVATLESELFLRQKIAATGEWIDYGVVSRRQVTTTGCGYIVDAWQNSVELENMKYHGFGTGGGAEGAANTALGTEITTEYATDNTRPTGTTAEASALVFQSVATLTPDASVACTEHGLFSQAATGGGVMVDRHLFSVINLASGDSLVATYQLTLTAGG